MSSTQTAGDQPATNGGAAPRKTTRTPAQLKAAAKKGAATKRARQAAATARAAAQPGTAATTAPAKGPQTGVRRGRPPAAARIAGAPNIGVGAPPEILALVNGLPPEGTILSAARRTSFTEMMDKAMNWFYPTTKAA